MSAMRSATVAPRNGAPWKFMLENVSNDYSGFFPNVKEPGCSVSSIGLFVLGFDDYK
jgi:hypothetical protein